MVSFQQALGSFRPLYDALTPDDRRDLLACLIARIEVAGDSVTYHLLDGLSVVDELGQNVNHPGSKYCQGGSWLRRTDSNRRPGG